MTKIPLHPWERARRRRDLFRHAIIGAAGGMLGTICFAVVRAILSK